MATSNKFGNYRLKQDTINELKRLKMAFEIANGGSTMSNDDFVVKMVQAVQEGNKPVWNAYEELTKTINILSQRIAEEKSK